MVAFFGLQVKPWAKLKANIGRLEASRRRDPEAWRSYPAGFTDISFLIHGDLAIR